MKRRPLAYAALVCGSSSVITPALADSPLSPNARWMTGDWVGRRAELLKRGVDIKLGWPQRCYMVVIRLANTSLAAPIKSALAPISIWRRYGAGSMRLLNGHQQP